MQALKRAHSTAIVLGPIGWERIISAPKSMNAMIRETTPFSRFALQVALSRSTFRFKLQVHDADKNEIKKG